LEHTDILEALIVETAVLPSGKTAVFSWTKMDIIILIDRFFEIFDRFYRKLLTS
jgi:hypothetical protein